MVTRKDNVGFFLSFFFFFFFFFFFLSIRRFLTKRYKKMRTVKCLFHRNNLSSSFWQYAERQFEHYADWAMGWSTALAPVHVH